jgi:hypothetical protein
MNAGHDRPVETTLCISTSNTDQTAPDIPSEDVVTADLV